MNNRIAKGDSLQLIAPSGGVVGGTFLKQGNIIGVVVASAPEGSQFTLNIAGVYSDAIKVSGEAWAVGQSVYLNAGATGFTTTASGGTFAGYAYEAALSAAVVGTILLSH